MVVLATTQVAAAQKTEIDVGGNIGLSLPTGDAADLYVPGWNAGGVFRIVPKNWPVGIQVDGVYSSYNRDVANVTDRGLTILTGSVGVVYQVELEQTSLEPYFIGGASVNRLSVKDPRTIDNYGSSTNMGLILGGGLAFKSEKSWFAPYLDFRVNGIFGSDPRQSSYININLGFLVLLQGRHSAP